MYPSADLSLVAPAAACQFLTSDKSYSIVGFYLLVLAVFAILIAAAATELVLASTRRRRSIGHYMNGFVMAYPALAFVFAAVAGAMIAHFFIGLAPEPIVKRWLWGAIMGLVHAIGSS